MNSSALPGGKVTFGHKHLHSLPDSNPGHIKMCGHLQKIWQSGPSRKLSKLYLLAENIRKLDVQGLPWPDKLNRTRKIQVKIRVIAHNSPFKVKSIECIIKKTEPACRQIFRLPGDRRKDGKFSPFNFC